VTPHLTTIVTHTFTTPASINFYCTVSGVSVARSVRITAIRVANVTSG
jgi:hypothetical protein